MARIHLYCPDWLHRRQRVELPNLNMSQLYNQALIEKLDGDDAVYLCWDCGRRTARALRFNGASVEPPVFDVNEGQRPDEVEPLPVPTPLRRAIGT